MATPAYVINLATATDRRERMLSHLHEQGITEARIFSGILGASLSESERLRCLNPSRARATYCRELTAGEIGCALSHLGVYQALLKTTDPWALVFEDDCQLRPGFLEVVNALARWLHTEEPRVVLLSPLRGFLTRRAQELAPSHRLVPIHRVWGAYGYALNRAAAERLVKVNTPLWLMADDWVRYRKYAGIALHGVDPFLVLPNELGADSHLADDRNASRANASKQPSTGRMQQRLIKIGRSLKEKLWLQPFHGLRRHRRPKSGF